MAACSHPSSGANICTQEKSITSKVSHAPRRRDAGRRHPREGIHFRSLSRLVLVVSSVALVPPRVAFACFANAKRKRKRREIRQRRKRRG
ncbi:hypothetical protein E2562_008186 [Oryza meyeriana var. granulata]|uniref:Uncharacterized protein n=1 Tax=Oryza meyeriana var. granulata TaxID=110450 RepID=A0A6G1CG72_9ORYZ|nr:hypothetical protein E2562_008186 [Oryza meyeriana var. granulata]